MAPDEEAGAGLGCAGAALEPVETSTNVTRSETDSVSAYEVNVAADDSSDPEAVSE